MKKITLVFLLALSSFGTAFGQLYVDAPMYDGSSSSVSGPNGTSSHKYMRASWLVLQSELTNFALTNSVVTNFGFNLLNGVSGAPVVGQFTVYLQNTADVTYNKGTNFAGIISSGGMLPHFVGTMTVPVSAGTNTIDLTLTTPFTYTGAGIYVAYEWEFLGPYSSTAAWYLANTTASGLTTVGGCREFSTISAPATLTNTPFRPSMRFGATNTATNEVAVNSLTALGKVSKLMPDVIETKVTNMSNSAKSNITVTLNISGANTSTSVHTIPTLASMASTVVTFNYIPTSVGLTTLAVSVDPDQLNSNNTWAWQQSVTCTDMAFSPPVPASSFSTQQWGYNTSGMYSRKYTPTATASLTGIRLALATSTSNTGKDLYGVLMDASGAVVATSNTLNIQASQLGQFVTFNFSPYELLLANTDYYMGVAIPAGPMFPYGTWYATTYSVSGYYASPITGGTLNEIDRGYIGIEAVVTFSNLLIDAITTRSVVCKNEKTQLIASGSPTAYTWVGPGVTGNSPTVTASPSVAAGSGTGTANYSVFGNDPVSGCKTNVKVVPVTISACTGLVDASQSNINLYPNPATNGKATLSGLSGANSVTVYNALGQLVLSVSATEETFSLDLSSQPAGNYIIKVTDSNDESRLLKIINQK
jgi:hypothetical protein